MATEAVKTDVKAPSKADIKGLFIKVDGINEKLFKAKKIVEDLETEKSGIVKVIAETAGKGPFSRGGKTLKIVVRQRKDDEENVVGETWFFRGETDKEVVSMD